jgi:hypothetical protein
MDQQEPKDLTALLGLDGLTGQELQETLVEMAEVLMQAVTGRVVPLLLPAEKDAFDELLSGNPTEEEVYGFLKEHVHALDAIVEEEAARMRDVFERVMPPLAEK